MIRILRRLIIRYFGGVKNFLIWVSCVVLTIYLIDTWLLTQDRIDNYVRSATPAPKKCGLDKGCEAGTYAYYIKSGEGKDIGPTICFEDEYLMTPKSGNTGRGINMVVIDDMSRKMVDRKVFDTYVSDSELIRYLKTEVKDHHVILVASQDEITANLGEESKTSLRKYGAGAITNILYRESYILLGQKGLVAGDGVEKVGKRGDGEFADPIYLSGCLKIPIGNLVKVDDGLKANVKAGKEIKKGDELKNCGMPDPCDSSSFPVHINAGQGNKALPKMCISEKYVFAEGVNDAGRGFNIAVVDPTTKDILRLGRFDTYAQDSSLLEIFLEQVEDGQIVVAVTNDDASTKLNNHAKELFNKLGSSQIQNVRFRDTWAMAGMKGIGGFTQFEQLQFAGANGEWPEEMDMKMCVPTQIKGSKIRPDPLVTRNDQKREFCKKYDGYGEFCDARKIDEPMAAATLSDPSLEGNAIFDVPIVVIPGLNHNALRMQLETILMQPGIQPKNVHVMYDEKFDESAALTNVFGYNAVSLSSSVKYTDQMKKAISYAFQEFKDAQNIIFLEEEVILGSDFLSYMAQTLPLLESDSTIAAISAWNDNGYEGVSGNSSLLYRVSQFPGLGFMLKREFYDTYMKDKLQECCSSRTWDGWLNQQEKGIELVVPDVSRVYRRPYEGMSDQAGLLQQLFNRQKRITSLDGKVKLQNVMKLKKDSYETELESLLKTSIALDTKNFGDCQKETGLGFTIPSTTDKTYTIYFKTESTLETLCRCFKLFHLDGTNHFKPRGLHNGMLRFTYEGKNNIFLIGASSPYYKYKPTEYTPVSS
ncbi:unnamed protein product [Owenia fusiformis]|uniref:ILEI/PANDER domain-containing protein n=1 Tax=Owenia fusiformis TaxID=6347 RepID=A0A8S4NUF5_OWEFU|nr:unnamed protein product [Owenia fusiformis]